MEFRGVSLAKHPPTHGLRQGKREGPGAARARLNHAALEPSRVSPIRQPDRDNENQPAAKWNRVAGTAAMATSMLLGLGDANQKLK